MKDYLVQQTPDYLYVDYSVCGLSVHDFFSFHINVDMCEVGFRPLSMPYCPLQKRGGFGFGRVHRKYGQTMSFFPLYGKY
jgi:hypothetical protein